MSDRRITYGARSHHAYRTRSNRMEKVILPGNRIAGHIIEKASSRPKCGDCKRALPGLPAIRPYQYKSLAKRERTVSRAYGGSRCHKCVRTRIVRAFLEEEKKKVKALLAQGKKD